MVNAEPAAGWPDTAFSHPENTRHASAGSKNTGSRLGGAFLFIIAISFKNLSFTRKNSAIHFALSAV
jgi:hypothetical protein